MLLLATLNWECSLRFKMTNPGIILWRAPLRWSLYPLKSSLKTVHLLHWCLPLPLQRGQWWHTRGDRWGINGWFLTVYPGFLAVVMVRKGRRPPLRVLEEMRAWGDRSGRLLGHIFHEEITWVIKSWRELSLLSAFLVGHWGKQQLNSPTQAGAAMVIAQLTTAKQRSPPLPPPHLHLHACLSFPIFLPPSRHLRLLSTLS